MKTNIPPHRFMLTVLSGRQASKDTIKKTKTMNRQQVIVALLQGVLFAVLMWVGDEFFLEDEKTSYIYIIEGAVFAVAMFFVNIFLDGKKK